jgi:hypothetical protein
MKVYQYYKAKNLNQPNVNFQQIFRFTKNDSAW